MGAGVELGTTVGTGEAVEVGVGVDGTDAVAIGVALGGTSVGALVSDGVVVGVGDGMCRRSFNDSTSKGM